MLRISSALNSELKASASAVVGVAAGANGGDRAFLGQPPGIPHRGQYTSLAFTEALLEAGIAGSIGSVGDALDNALMESTIGLYKTELIDRQRSGTGRNAVERETAAWVHWFNTLNACTQRSTTAHPSSSRTATATAIATADLAVA